MFDKPFYHLIFAHPLRVMYCPIPKAACTSWKSFLRREMGLPPVAAGELHGRQLNGFAYAASIEREDLIRMLFSLRSSYFKFTVCRNPYDRLRAAYRDLVAASDDRPPRGGKMVDDLRMVYCFAFDAQPSVVRHLSFAQFISAIEASPPASLDRHWQLQSVLTCSNLIKYSAVVKMEESDRFSELCEKMGAKSTMDLHLNRSKQDDSLRFSPSMKEAVQRVYARDFLRFRYDPDVVPE